MMLGLDKLPGKENREILCCYVNATSRAQIARISNIPNWYLEHVVFPGERFLFEALPEAELEIYQSLETGEIVGDRLECDRLKVEQG
ncbi:MAG: DUF1830 domain-containing protein, partial [Okeania sp. SIO2H7]|nr:DUF1830 domain-containing protein [Okeania sp. SIO2H7]